jgi:hypothetical protein
MTNTIAALCLNLFLLTKFASSAKIAARNFLVPFKRLDNFSICNFTDATVFDDTIRVADGQFDMGTTFHSNAFKKAMEEWVPAQGYLPGTRSCHWKSYNE